MWCESAPAASDSRASHPGADSGSRRHPRFTHSPKRESEHAARTPPRVRIARVTPRPRDRPGSLGKRHGGRAGASHSGTNCAQPHGGHAPHRQDRREGHLLPGSGPEGRADHPARSWVPDVVAHVSEPDPGARRSRRSVPARCESPASSLVVYWTVVVGVAQQRVIRGSGGVPDSASVVFAWVSSGGSRHGLPRRCLPESFAPCPMYHPRPPRYRGGARRRCSMAQGWWGAAQGGRTFPRTCVGGAAGIGAAAPRWRFPTPLARRRPPVGAVHL